MLGLNPSVKPRAIPAVVARMETPLFENSLENT